MFSNSNKNFTLPLGLLAEADAEAVPMSGGPSQSSLAEESMLTRPETEGQLAVDVAQTENELIIIAPIAGAPPDQVSLHLQNDVLTIRGERRSPVPPEAEYFYEECYWGKFSRTIVLPVDVKTELAKAEFKHGVLVVHLPKQKSQSNIPIYIVEE